MDQVQEVKSKADIVSVIGSRVELKRAGKNFRGLCPFHSEKTPSFFVSPEMQTFKCFGCGKGGDVLTFIQEYEGMDFREALEHLADRVGVKLESYRPSGEEQTKKQSLEILSLASEFYHYLLTKHQSGASARDYLKGRGVDPAMLSEFNLGWSPDSWDSLYKFLVTKKKYQPQAVEAVGLLVTGQSRGRGTSYYDRFRARVMFPLTDFSGKIVGFSGRLLDASAKEAKYVNTPETALYHKRQLLFGIGEAKATIRKKNQAIVVEGEFDVISSHAVGVTNVVGVKGSALTEDQVRLLLRLTRNLVLCLDADEAGIEATKRGVEVADQLGMDIEVISVTGGKDPDELARAHPQDWKKLVAHPISVYQFQINAAFNKYDSTTIKGKKRIAEDLTLMLTKINNKVEQAYYLKDIARRLSVGEDALSQEMEKHQRQHKLAGSAPQPQTQPIKDLTRTDLLENYLWGLLLSLEGSTFLKAWKELQELSWSNPGLGRLATAVTQHLDQHHANFNLAGLTQQLPPELSGLVGKLYLNEQTVQYTREEDIWSELIKVTTNLKQLSLKAHLSVLKDQITALESGDQDTQDQSQLEILRRQFSNLLSELNQSTFTSGG